MNRRHTIAVAVGDFLHDAGQLATTALAYTLLAVVGGAFGAAAGFTLYDLAPALHTMGAAGSAIVTVFGVAVATGSVVAVLALINTFAVPRKAGRR